MSQLRLYTTNNDRKCNCRFVSCFVIDFNTLLKPLHACLLAVENEPISAESGPPVSDI